MHPSEYRLMDEAEERLWWYRALHRRLLASLSGSLSIDAVGRVLDAGCGTGGLLARMRAAWPDLELHGVEFAAEAAARARDKSGARVVRGSVNALPYPDRCFDAVVAADVLCHAAVQPRRALAECFRVLREGGRLVVNMPAFAWLASGHDRHVHNARRQSANAVARDLAAAGFGAVEAHYWNGLLFPAMIVQRKLLEPLRARLRNGGAAQSRSDLAAFPPWLDAIFGAVAAIEHHLPLRLPAGGSVLAVATRPSPPGGPAR